MKAKLEKISLKSRNQVEFINITSQVQEVVDNSGIKNGIVVVFSPHTTASIVVNHDESMLIQDMTRMLYKLVPIDERYGHDMFELNRVNKSDGRSNGHSHCKNILLGTSETFLVENGELILGERQNIFFVELDGARKRDFLVKVMGE